MPVKTAKLFLPICLLLLFLCACGGPSPASEAQLRKDLESSEESLFSYYSEQLQASVTNFDVVKRQTIVEDQKDTAWVQVSIEGPEVRGNFHYIMSYELYNDGWKLENVQQDREIGWRIEPLVGPEINLTSQLPPNAELISSTVELDANEPYATYEYTYTEIYPYCEVIYKKAFDYTFDYSADGVWCFKQTRDTGTVEKWNIDGVWSIGDKNGQFYCALCLDGFSPQGIADGLTESHDSYDVNGWYRERFYTVYQIDNTTSGPFYRCYAYGGKDYGLPISYTLSFRSPYYGYADLCFDINYYGVFPRRNPVFELPASLNRE